MSRGKTIIVLVILFLIMIFAILGCGNDKVLEDIKNNEVAASTQETTAGRLVNAFNSNEFAANEQYKDKIVTISGRIFSVGELDWSKYLKDDGKYFKYFASIDGYAQGAVGNVIIAFRDVHKDDLLKLQKGQYVKIKGMVRYKGHSVYVSDGVIVK